MPKISSPNESNAGKKRATLATIQSNLLLINDEEKKPDGLQTAEQQLEAIELLLARGFLTDKVCEDL